VSCLKYTLTSLPTLGPPMPIETPQSILVMKLRYIGDVVLSTPVLTRLREGFPKARITMLVNAGTEEVVQDHPALDEVMVVAREGLRNWRLPVELRRRRFDVVVDLTDGDRSAILGRMSGAPTRIGYNSEHRWRGRLYTHIVKADRFAMHTIQYHLAATEALGLSGVIPEPQMTVAPDARDAARSLLQEAMVDADKPFVCLHPGARWWFKSWPAERFAALADRIQTHSPAQVLFLGSERDRKVIGDIASAMETACLSLVGRTRLQDLAAILSRARLMISNDNGPMHIAAAMGTPVIGLFGPSDPAIWGPWGGGHRTFYKQVDCRSCFHPDCFRGEANCMRLISLDEVWEAVGARLKETLCTKS
jgi:predicted lipopolysaccharide heptosyltransferase III